MRLKILAVGRLRAGPEADLVADYLARFDRAGRGIGLGPVEVTEITTAGGVGAEAIAIARRLPDDGIFSALDERGETMASPDFARYLKRMSEAGRRELALVIGGPDGLDPGLRERAERLISLGPMVWPHMLVRAMLAEQLYRAASILSGGPYHRA